MRITWTLRIFTYFSAKTNPETETSVLGCGKTETNTEFKIPQPPNTSEKRRWTDESFTTLLQKSVPKGTEAYTAMTQLITETAANISPRPTAMIEPRAYPLATQCITTGIAGSTQKRKEIVKFSKIKVE